MNVFEDLIVELKEENLLEDNTAESRERDVENRSDLEETQAPNRYLDDAAVGDIDAPVSTLPASKEMADRGDEVSNGDFTVMDNGAAEKASQPKKPKNGQEFYRKRAVGEVSNLQMVEHVLTGVEREYLKILPAPFDDFQVKKTLHAFLQVTENENASDHQEAEFNLMQETEAWCSALEARDQKVPVSSLRQWCENSRPALSSQAMLAVARFYRNLPYSESVRAKFDFVITRLFSRHADHNKRVCLFNREETLNHINTLYRDWSSISLYAIEDDNSDIMLTALSFEDLAAEAEKAGSFDELISSDFFGRLRIFKESISEIFYAPSVTAAAVECNIRIGNAYVSLIERERQKMDAASIQSKYGDLNDQSVSDGAARTLQLVELLREREVEPTAVQEVEAPPAVVRPDPVAAAPVAEKQFDAVRGTKSFISSLFANAFAINRWVLVFAAVLIAASIGIYVWANFFAAEEVSSTKVKTVEITNATLQSYAKHAKASGDNFYVMLTPEWDGLPKEKRVELLQTAYKIAQENGSSRVSLIAKDGKQAGFASPTRLDVIMP